MIVICPMNHSHYVLSIEPDLIEPVAVDETSFFFNIPWVTGGFSCYLSGWSSKNMKTTNTYMCVCYTVIPTYIYIYIYYIYILYIIYNIPIVCVLIHMDSYWIYDTGFFNVATDSLFRPPAEAVTTTSLAIPQQPKDTVCTTVIHGSLNVPIEHHPTIRYMVYNGYCKVMSSQNGTVTNPCDTLWIWSDLCCFGVNSDKHI